MEFAHVGDLIKDKDGTEYIVTDVNLIDVSACNDMDLDPYKDSDGIRHGDYTIVRRKAYCLAREGVKIRLVLDEEKTKWAEQNWPGITTAELIIKRTANPSALTIDEERFVVFEYAGEVLEVHPSEAIEIDA